MNERQEKIIRKAMSILGSRTSEKKARASKENGKKGGRPKAGDKIGDMSTVLGGKGR